MSDNKDKPADFDPDATVTSARSAPAGKPDADATVMMTRDALKEPDEDATVTMNRSALKEPDSDATVMMPPGGFKPDAEAAAAAAPPPAPPMILDQEPSRLPMIAGGIVVVLVVLYFVMSGGKGPAPEAAKTGPVATAPAPSTPAPAPSTPAPAPSTPAPAPSTSAPAATIPAAPAPAAAGGADVKDQLAAFTKRGQVAVAEEGGGTTITIAGTHQFASGGVDPEPALRALLAGIGAALDKVPGTIVVTGHADAKPSSNPKFPSNQELSAARAQSAAKVMAAKLGDPKRVTSEGAADSKPLAPSDTAENRAKNRRVVIVVRP